MWWKWLLMAIILLLLVIVLFNSKINVSKIIKNHYGSYRNDKNDKVSKFDYFVFEIIPIVISAMLVWGIDYRVEDESVFLTVFSIFTALLFTFLAMLVPLKSKKSESADAKVNYEKFLKCIKQTYDSVSYLILISIVVIVVLVALPYTQSIFWLYGILSMMFVYLGIKAILTLLMVLKRIYVLFGL